MPSPAKAEPCISARFSRATLVRHGPLFVTAVAMAFAVAALSPIVAVQQGSLALPAFSSNGWIAVLFLGSIAGAVQFSLFMWALRWLAPTTTVLYLTLNPMAAMVLGIVVLGESLTTELVAGRALVISGIVVGSGAWARRGCAVTRQPGRWQACEHPRRVLL